MDDLLSFVPEPQKTPRGTNSYWNILIVDDEPSVHDVTHFALKGFFFEGRSLHFESAFSGQNAIEKLKAKPDFFQVLLLDMVMEHRHAGIDVIRYLRNEIQNRITQIVVRTGNPGLAPEDYLVHHFEINDYEEKNSLTVQRLKTALTTALRAFRNIEVIQQLVARKMVELQELRLTMRHITMAPEPLESAHSKPSTLVSLPLVLRTPQTRLRPQLPTSTLPEIGMSLQFIQDKIAATTRKAIAIYDYNANNYRFVSDNIEDITGFSWDKMVQNLQMGGNFSPDAPKIDRVNKQLRKIFAETNPMDKAQFVAIYDYRLTLAPPHNTRMLEYITPLLLGENGQLLLSLHVFSNINHLKKADANSILAIHLPERHHYFSISDYRMDEIFFGPREQEIMEYSDKNLLSKEIAKEINLSVHTVDTHLRNLRDRFGVNSTNALLTYCKEITHLFTL